MRDGESEKILIVGNLYGHEVSVGCGMPVDLMLNNAR